MFYEKSKHFVFTCLCFISMKTFAKNSDSTAFYKGKIIFSVGYGFPSIDKALYIYGQPNSSQLDMSFSKTGYGPFHFRAEYGLSQKIGIGISINYDTYGGILKIFQPIFDPNGTNVIYDGTYKKSTSSLSGLIRFNYHFATTKKLDPYFSFGAGFKKIKNTFTTDAMNGSVAGYN